MQRLTYLSAADQGSLLCLKCGMASASFEELYESIGLLYRDLSKFAVFVEKVEHVSLGDSFGRKVSCG